MLDNKYSFMYTIIKKKKKNIDKKNKIKLNKIKI